MAEVVEKTSSEPAVSVEAPLLPPRECTTADALAKKHLADKALLDAKISAMKRPRLGKPISSAQIELQAAGLREEYARTVAAEKAQLEAYLAYLAAKDAPPAKPAGSAEDGASDAEDGDAADSAAAAGGAGEGEKSKRKRVSFDVTAAQRDVMMASPLISLAHDLTLALAFTLAICRRRRVQLLQQQPHQDLRPLQLRRRPLSPRLSAKSLRCG